MPTASPTKLPGGDTSVCYERLRARAEARHLSDRVLRETAQRAREALAGGVSARLPDGGKRLRLRMEASLGELSNRGLGKLVCEIYGSIDPRAIAEYVQCKATLPHSASLEAATQRAGPVSVVATTSPEELFGNDLDVVEAETRQLLADAVADSGKELQLQGDVRGEAHELQAFRFPHRCSVFLDCAVSISFSDRVVCEICGSGRNPHLIANCVRCNEYMHCYCMQVVTFVIPDEWCCDGCKERLIGQPDPS